MSVNLKLENEIVMSVAEMKIEVINKITSLNDETLLKEVLSLLCNPNERPDRPLKLSSSYELIKAQYGDVLQKLAQ